MKMLTVTPKYFASAQTPKGADPAAAPAEGKPAEGAPPEGGDTPPPSEEPPKDGVSLGYRLGRGAVSLVGAGIGASAGTVVGGFKGVVGTESKAPDWVHNTIRVTGAVLGIAAAVPAAIGLGPLAAVGTVAIGAIAGGAAGAGFSRAAEVAFDGVKGAVTEAWSMAKGGWNVAGGLVDKIAAKFAKEPEDPGQGGEPEGPGAPPPNDPDSGAPAPPSPPPGGPAPERGTDDGPRPQQPNE